MGKLHKYLRNVLKEVIVEGIFRAIEYAFIIAKVVGLMVGGFISWLVSLRFDWPLVVLAFILGSSIVIIAIDLILQWRGKSKLKVVFCDERAQKTAKPKGMFWVVGTNSISYLVRGYFSLENLSSKDTTLKSAFVEVRVKREQLGKGLLINFPTNTLLKARKYTPNPIKLHSQLMIDEYSLRQLVGTDYGDADLMLAIEAVGLKPAKVKFGKSYGYQA